MFNCCFHRIVFTKIDLVFIKENTETDICCCRHNIALNSTISFRWLQIQETEEKTIAKNHPGSIYLSCAIPIEKPDDFGKNTKARKKQFYIDAFGWGFVLWLIGYLLGLVLFFVVPVDMLGWVIMPIGTIITLWVLFKKIKGDTFNYYLYLGIVWMLIAIVFDYIFIVKALSSEGYYKLDVYLYYALTFILPLAAYWRKKSI